jgi:hypothetical protein
MFYLLTEVDRQGLYIVATYVYIFFWNIVDLFSLAGGK